MFADIRAHLCAKKINLFYLNILKKLKTIKYAFAAFILDLNIQIDRNSLNYFYQKNFLLRKVFFLNSVQFLVHFYSNASDEHDFFAKP